MHAAPAVPQVVAVPALHVVPEQHPVGHTQPLQAPAVHVWSEGHALQACPALPHAALSVPVLQVLPSQHPCGHVVASQTHLPAAHFCPAAQAAPEPHWQAPLALQPSLVVAPHPLQTQAPFEQVLPGAHAGPDPHAEPSWLSV